MVDVCLKRQLRIELDFAQHDARAHLRDGRNLEDALMQKRVVRLDIWRHDCKDVVGFAGCAVALGDFGARRDLTLELFDAAFRVTSEMDMRERADVQAELFTLA